MFVIESPSDIEGSKSEEIFLPNEKNVICKKDIFLINKYQNFANNFLNTENIISSEYFKDSLDFNKVDIEVEETEAKDKTLSQNANVFNIINYKKRGRFCRKDKKNTHLSSDFDNLQRKIQVHFLTFVVNLCNDALKVELQDKYIGSFKQIDYQIKKVINHKYVNQLHLMSIKELLKMKISPKNKNFSEDTNLVILQKVSEDSTFLKEFFDIKYLEFFDKFYFNEEKEINRIYFQGKEIVFSKKTKPFYHLIKKYESQKNLLIDSAKSIYFYGYNSLIGNNSFKTMRNERKKIEQKEEI